MDHKTPLLRSMEALSNQAVRLLHLLGKPEVERVVAMAGAEQESFLVDKELFDQRLDLMLCNRTLFGARPPKGQEMDGHYYGNVKERVMDFMRELDEELWRLGVPAKTEHNEAAPAQHELAAVYTIANIACDNNQLIMETMKKVALRKGLVCLLHEKPFEGVNGSGKHNNWSLNILQRPQPAGSGQDTGGQRPVPAVFVRRDLGSGRIRRAAARFGHHARATTTGWAATRRRRPSSPCFWGMTWTDILEEHRDRPALPAAPGRQHRDRRQRHPLACRGIHRTGTALRPLPLPARSSNSACWALPCPSAPANNALNAAVAEISCRIADRLEKAEDRQACVRELIREIYRDHKRVVFNGNNYSRVMGGRSQGAGPALRRQRCGRRCRAGVHQIHRLVRKARDLPPQGAGGPVQHPPGDLCAHPGSGSPHHAGYGEAPDHPGGDQLHQIPGRLCVRRAIHWPDGGHVHRIQRAERRGGRRGPAENSGIRQAGRALEKAATIEDVPERARAYRDKVGTAMAALREVSDRLEMLVSKEYWPIPTSSDLLFQV